MSTSQPSAELAARTEAGRYRPDVDGLRAIAVLLVVAYHAFPRWAPGGFIGVDIFFVISGFLITRIIADQRDNRRFRFIDFYSRRARRILPVYVVMTAVVAVAAAVILLPRDLQMFGGALAASSLFLTNAWFANTVVYFEPASRNAPLLHLWSLAVEEQFYLVWPLLIAGLSLPWVRRLRPVLLLALAALSLILAEQLIGRGATRDAFYYLPGRAWEFLVGGVLALRVLPAPASRWSADAAVLAGLLLIAGGFLMLNDASAFPGLGAVAPCVGAALILWSGLGEPPAAAALLRAPPVVGLGRVSYSFYLWHWPPLVLAGLILQQPLPPLLSAGLVALALGIAILSWRFVEQPWRAAKGRWSHAGLAVLIAVVLVGAGAAAYVTHGLPGRIPPGLVLEDTDISPMRSTCFLGWTPQIEPPTACVYGDLDAPAKVLVWGDSHADAITPGVLAWTQGKGLRVAQATRAGCPPLTGVAVLTDGLNRDPNCARFDSKVLARLASDPSITLVILSARWPLYMNAAPPMGGYDPPMSLISDGGTTGLAAALDHTLGAIEASGSKARVLVIGPIPELPVSPPDCVAQASRFGLDLAHCQQAPNADTLARADPAIRAIQQVTARHPDVRVVLPSRDLCSGGSCGAVEDGDILYFDSDHLSASGARRLVPGWLDKALAGSTPGARR